MAGVCLQDLSKNHPLPASYQVKPDYRYQRALLTALTKQDTFFFLAFSWSYPNYWQCLVW